MEFDELIRASLLAAIPIVRPALQAFLCGKWTCPIVIPRALGEAKLLSKGLVQPDQVWLRRFAEPKELAEAVARLAYNV